ncbi:MAG: aldose 1-epimerase family protein [Clostridiales bacterium]|nr:aldose 1-epimerase family protein [Clostridiales bacterium]
MNKKDLLSYVGNVQQLMSVRPVVYREGRAGGLEAYEVKNDRLSFSVMAGKCLDIAEVNFNGYNMSFLSKPGLAGRNHYDTHGQEAQRSIMGGMLFTCGLENICAPCTVDGKDYPMHGRIRTTPAEHVGAQLIWDEEGCTREKAQAPGAKDSSRGTAAPCKIRICGEMREGELFGENMVLRRCIETRFGEPEIVIKDRITNEGFRQETMMLLYHFNAGYPFLNESCEIILPTAKVTPRDEAAKANMHLWNKMEPPKDNAPERVYLHELAADENGNTFAAVINEALGIGLRIGFNKKYLPYFMQWKSIASGDYVIGLEPANSSVLGKEYHLKRGDLHTLEPFETEEIELRLRFLEGAEINAVREDAARLAPLGR